MTTNPQELDDILNTLLNVPMWFTAPDRHSELQDIVKKLPLSPQTEAAKQAILDWHNRQIEEVLTDIWCDSTDNDDVAERLRLYIAERERTGKSKKSKILKNRALHFE